MPTIAEHVLSAHAGRDVRAGDLVVCDVDWIIGTDASAPMAIDYFERMGGTRVRDSARVIFSLDHYDPSTRPATAKFHDRVRAVATTTGVRVLEAGEGISHQVAVERALVRPGELVVGADSHTVTCGALNVFAVGVGSSELAAAMLTGQMWFRVPETVRIAFHGQRRAQVSAKDVALELVRQFGGDGANYQALEFAGSAVSSFSIDDRMVIASLAVEMGAKAAVFPFDEVTARFVASADAAVGRSASFTPVRSDDAARFVRTIDVDLSAIGPVVSRPHLPEHVVLLSAVARTPVHMVFIGTCTGGRASDVRAALDAIDRNGGQIAPGVQVVITPASRAVRDELVNDGTLARFERLGAIVTTPGCGACCGTSGVIPEDGMTVLSTANRNFKGRMGNRTASIYLASPATCGAAAATGMVGEPL